MNNSAACGCGALTDTAAPPALTGTTSIGSQPTGPAGGRRLSEIGLHHGERDRHFASDDHIGQPSRGGSEGTRLLILEAPDKLLALGLDDAADGAGAGLVIGRPDLALQSRLEQVVEALGQVGGGKGRYRCLVMKNLPISLCGAFFVLPRVQSYRAQ